VPDDAYLRKKGRAPSGIRGEASERKKGGGGGGGGAPPMQKNPTEGLTVKKGGLLPRGQYEKGGHWGQTAAWTPASQ